MLIDVLVDLVQDQGTFGYIWIEFGIRFSFLKLVFILVGSLDVLVAKSASDTQLQNNLILVIVFTFLIPELNLAVETLRRNIQPNEFQTNFFNELCNISQHIQVKVSSWQHFFSDSSGLLMNTRLSWWPRGCCCSSSSFL